MSFLQNKKEPSSEDQLTIESNTTETNTDLQNEEASNNGKIIEKDNIDSSKREEVSKFLLVHGGMDTEGNVFDDLFFINLE
jgi:hypothetical protein